MQATGKRTSAFQYYKKMLALSVRSDATNKPTRFTESTIKRSYVRSCCRP